VRSYSAAVEDAVYLACLFVAPLVFAAGLVALGRRDARAPDAGAARIAAANVLVLCLLFSIVLTIAELGLRFALDLSDGLGRSRVSQRWFDRHWRMNGVGVRDDVEYGEGGGLRLAPPPGIARLTFLGDSVTAAQGVPDVADRFANRIRAELAPGREVHVIAENDFDTGDQLATLRDLFEQGYRTDVVALVHFPNDITDLLPAWRATLRDAIEDAARRPAVVRASDALDFAWWRIRLAREPAVRRYADVVREAYAGSTWRLQQSRLLALRDLVSTHEARLVVATLPFFDRVGPVAPLRDAYAGLDRFWREAGVPHLDLTAHFDSDDPRRLVASRFDDHPNAATHARIADALLPFLRSATAR
jgi:hypothetical protein